MVKTLRTIVPSFNAPNTTATELTGSEKEFVNKHKIEVVADANGNGDEVFKGSAVKTFDRSKHREGVQKDVVTTKKVIPIDTFVTTTEGSDATGSSDSRSEYDNGDGRYPGESDEDFANRCLHEAIEEVNASQDPDEEEDGEEGDDTEESLQDPTEDDEEEGLSEGQQAAGKVVHRHDTVDHKHMDKVGKQIAAIKNMSQKELIRRRAAKGTLKQSVRVAQGMSKQ